MALCIKCPVGPISIISLFIRTRYSRDIPPPCAAFPCYGCTMTIVGTLVGRAKPLFGWLGFLTTAVVATLVSGVGLQFRSLRGLGTGMLVDKGSPVVTVRSRQDYLPVYSSCLSLPSVCKRQELL